MGQVAVNKISWPSRTAFVTDLVGVFQQLGLGFSSAQILTAHIALSTGWGKAADNYRLAGIKYNASCPNYTVVQGFENVGGQKVYSDMKWCAYDSLLEGAQAMLDLLQKPRYATSWKMLQNGDPEYFAQVGRDGWYTADPAVVAADAKARLAEIQTITGMEEPETEKAGFGLVGIGLLIGLGWLIMKWWKK